ncbi:MULTISPECIES: hypothetical protein [Bradyrhizobium]|nr:MULTISPECIES: hypothetical protein [Bradyrhizobium]WOH60385.1 hypothetical protein RX329_09950 [Bradyrhizobium sp. BWC-3-1]
MAVQSSDFIVNSTTAGDQTRPTVTTLPHGHFEVTWHAGNYNQPIS